EGRGGCFGRVDLGPPNDRMAESPRSTRSPASSQGCALKSASSDAIFDAPGGILMRTTVTLDDGLFADAEELTGIKEKSALVNAALKALVEREAARRLARLGG